MCAISGYYCFKETRPCKEKLEAMLLEGGTRGDKATGIGYFKDAKTFIVNKFPISAEKFIETTIWKDFIPTSPIMIMHNRMPTQGDISNNDNNHPLIINRVVMIHNGTIYNEVALFKDHPKWERKAEVDSEILGHILNEGEYKELLGEVRGTYATASIHLDRPKELLLLRRTSPLKFVYDKRDDILYFASTEYMLAKVIDEVDLTCRGFKLSFPDHRFIIWGAKSNYGYLINGKGLALSWELPPEPAAPITSKAYYPYSGFKSQQSVGRKKFVYQSGSVYEVKEGKLMFTKCQSCLKTLKKSLRDVGICRKCSKKLDSVDKDIPPYVAPKDMEGVC